MVYNKSYRSAGGRIAAKARLADRVSAQRRAARIIAKTPALRGYARTGSAYTAKYRYGTSPTGEVKFLDTATAFLFDTTGEVPATGQLNLVPQGVEESQRVGRKITIKSINIRWIVSSGAGTSGSDSLRLLLVQDTQANGAAATYSGVGGVLESDSVTAFRNLENSNRFIIHKDWFINMNPTAGIVGAFNQTNKVITFNKKCNIPIEFDSSASTGAIGTIRSNNLFLLARSAAVDDGYQCAGVVRIRYTDN